MYLLPQIILYAIYLLLVLLLLLLLFNIYYLIIVIVINNNIIIIIQQSKSYTSIYNYKTEQISNIIILRKTLM